MLANGEGANSKMTFGGVDESLMLNFPSPTNKTFYYYQDRNNDKEWGTEIRNILIGNKTHNFSVDSGYLTYARVDTFSPFILLPWDNFDMY
jgi:hypothetical protein